MDDETGGDGLRERLTRQGEDALGRLAQDLLENPIINGAIARAFEAREKAAQAQEVAFGAFNIPSASDIERLTRRVRSVSQRLEGIEDGVDRLDERLAGPPGLARRDHQGARRAAQGDAQADEAGQAAGCRGQARRRPRLSRRPARRRPARNGASAGSAPRPRRSATSSGSTAPSMATRQAAGMPARAAAASTAALSRSKARASHAASA